MTTTEDLSTTIAGGTLVLPTCIYNASGPRSGTTAALSKVAASSSTGAVLSKSATLVKQTGNPMPRTHHDDDDGGGGTDGSAGGGASFNSEGLPNNGIDYYIDASNIQEIMDSASPSGSSSSKKPYFVSLSGKTTADNLEMLQRIFDANEKQSQLIIQSVELNLACPNIIGKSIIGYDVSQTEDILQQVSSLYHQMAQKSSKKSLPVLGIKLPPYLDFVLLAQVASVLQKYSHVVKYIVCINTVGNALAINAEAGQPYIRSNHGYAGMSGGRAVHAIACSNVAKFYSLFHASNANANDKKKNDTNIDIVGCGGVVDATQVVNLLMAGACAVQVGTTHWKEGPACFDRLARELKEWMQQPHHEHYFFSSSASLSEKKITSLIGWIHHHDKDDEWSPERASQARSIRKAAKSAAAATATANTTLGGNNGGDQQEGQQLTFYKFTTALLVVLVAILAADKWGQANGGLLPTE